MLPYINAACKEKMEKCLHSAKETIESIYETYRDHVYFRTWSALILIHFKYYQLTYSKQVLQHNIHVVRRVNHSHIHRLRSIGSRKA